MYKSTSEEQTKNPLNTDSTRDETQDLPRDFLEKIIEDPSEEEKEEERIKDEIKEIIDQDLKDTIEKIDKINSKSPVKGSFRFSNTKAMFTYKTHIDKELIEKFFNNLSKSGACRFIRSAHETGKSDPKTPYDHTHTVVDFGKTFCTTSAKKFDLKSGNEIIHPHIQLLTTPAHFRNAKNYLSKEDKANADLRIESTEKILRAIGSKMTNKEFLIKNIQRRQDGTINFSEISGLMMAKEIMQEEEVFDLKPPIYSWAKELEEEIKGRGNNRKVIWYYDDIGGAGKTTFQSYMADNPETSNDWFVATDMGTARDAATILSEAKKRGWTGRGTIIDLPRTVEEAKSRIYQILEGCANGMMTATKYTGGTVRWRSEWIIVFANWLPMVHKMSMDRWDIREIKHIEGDKIAVEVNPHELRDTKFEGANMKKARDALAGLTKKEIYDLIDEMREDNIW